MADPGLSYDETKRLSRTEAEAVIARRLATLGHDPGFVSAEAQDEIIARAAGSARHIRHALSATLFLAVTEGLPYVAAEDVCRAVPAAPDSPHTSKPAAVAVPSAHSARGLLTGGAIVLVYLALCCLLIPPALRHLPAIGSPHSLVLGRGDLPRVSAFQPVAYLHAAQAPPLMPRIAEQTVPAVEAPAPPDLPQTPPATVVLVASKATPANRKHRAAILQALHQAGFDDVREAHGPATGACRFVCYFFTEDSGVAARIASIVASATRAPLPQNHADPTLLTQSPQRAVQPPGSVNIAVW